jgi:histone H4
VCATTFSVTVRETLVYRQWVNPKQRAVISCPMQLRNQTTRKTTSVRLQIKPLSSSKMSGRGKGGKGAGKGGAKRHRKVLRDNIQGITKPAIRRLARRGGVKRISGLVYEETRGVLKVFLEHVLRDAITYTEHARRKTVTAMDVVYALKRQGRTLYGYDGSGAELARGPKARVAPKPKRRRVRPVHIQRDHAPPRPKEEEQKEEEEEEQEDEEEEKQEEEQAGEDDNNGGGGGGDYYNDDVDMVGGEPDEQEEQEQKGEDEDEGEEEDEEEKGEEAEDAAKLVRARQQVHDLFEKEKALWTEVKSAAALRDAKAKLNKASTELETVIIESLKAKHPRRHFHVVLCEPIPEHDRLRKSLVDIFRASDPDLDVCGMDDDDAGSASASSGSNGEDVERVTAAFKKQCVFGELNGGRDKYIKYMAEGVMPSTSFYAIVATDKNVAENRNNAGGFDGFRPHKNNRILAFAAVECMTTVFGSVFDLQKHIRTGRFNDSVEHSLYPEDSHLLSVRAFCGTKAHGQAWNLLRYAFLWERHMALDNLPAASPHLGPTLITVGLARGPNGGLLKSPGDRSKSLHSKLSKLYHKKLGVDLVAPMWKTMGDEAKTLKTNSQALSALERESDHIRYLFVPKHKDAPKKAGSKKKKGGAAAAAAAAPAAGTGTYIFLDHRDLYGDMPGKIKAIRAQIERKDGDQAARTATDDDLADADRVAPFGPELDLFAPLEQVLAASKDRV